MKLRRYTNLILVIIVAMSLSSCAKTKYEDNGELLVVATNFPAYDFARQITGDKADVSMLIKPGCEVHTYEPSPKDIELINNCDVFIYTGGESDSWLDSVLESADTNGITKIKMMDYALCLEEEHKEGMDTGTEGYHEHSHGEHNHDDEHAHEYDEHVWTSPVNAIKITEGICDGIVTADPDNIEYYRNNTNEYITRLQNLDIKIRDTVANGKRKTVIFGDRFPLLHFTKEYGLDYYAAYPGCVAESEPNVKTVIYLIEKVKSEQIPVVFHIELSNEKMADTICEETGATKELFSSCHNVTAEEFESGITYIDIMEKNLAALEKALN